MREPVMNPLDYWRIQVADICHYMARARRKARIKAALMLLASIAASVSTTLAIHHFLGA